MANSTKPLVSTNLPNMDVERLIASLSNSYSQLINKGLPMKTFPSVMLWGAPGVGKSQAVRQIAKEIEDRTGKKTVVTDVRLLLFNPIDLRGIPTANEDKTLAVWLKPKIFQMDESDKIVNILFLDEISAAPQSVQAAAYQITLDRVVGEHKLPENCIVIAAGNRITDKSVAYKMPKALANRLLHIDVEAKFEAWKSWAVRNGIHPMVTGFLTYRQDLLIENSSESDDLAFPTPRSWEMVSNILNNISTDMKEVYPLISGLVGSGIATELRTWCKLYDQLPSIEGIFKGTETMIPKGSPDTMYALCSSMAAYAREHKDNIKLIENSIKYAQGFSADFSVVLITDYLSIEKGYREKLMKSPVFVSWINTKGRFLNGII